MTGKMTRIYCWGPIRAKRCPERFEIKNLPSTDSGFFCATGALQQRHQIFLMGHDPSAQPIVLKPGSRSTKPNPPKHKAVATSCLDATSHGLTIQGAFLKSSLRIYAS